MFAGGGAEGTAAGAGLDGIGILNAKAAAHQAVNIINFGPIQVLDAAPIYDHFDAIHIKFLVAKLGPYGECQSISQS